jgi:MarR family transcriptional regulator, 2-MHQ and catechol-resistance regulon repressor
VGTRYQGSRSEVDSLNAYIALVRAANAVSGRLSGRLREHGLTESQFGVLEALHHVGPMCQNALGEKLLKSGGNMTLVIDNLEKRSLVRRQRDPADRRYVIVDLTDEGRHTIASMFPDHAVAITDQMGVLTSTELQALRKLCRAVGRGVSTSDGPNESIL